MSSHVDRRELLRMSVGAAFAAGLTATTLVPAGSASAGPRPRGLPPVPGMSGDRKANEFWYVFDDVLYFNQPAELTAAYQAVRAHFADVEEGVAYFWFAQRNSGAYRANYTAKWAPVRSSLKVIADAQTAIIDQFYRHDDRGLESAFVDFAQGVLYDPRRPASPVHTMDNTPPAGYHIWHAYGRATSLLGIESKRWDRIGRLNGIAWHLQSIAKPSTTTLSEPLDPRVVRDVRRLWWGRGVEQIEEAFESVPYPAGVS